MPALIQSNSKEIILIKAYKIFKKMRIMTGRLIPMEHNKSVWKDEGTSRLKVFGAITEKI